MEVLLFPVCVHAYILLIQWPQILGSESICKLMELPTLIELFLRVEKGISLIPFISTKGQGRLCPAWLACPGVMGLVVLGWIPTSQVPCALCRLCCS